MVQCILVYIIHHFFIFLSAYDMLSLYIYTLCCRILIDHDYIYIFKIRHCTIHSLTHLYDTAQSRVYYCDLPFMVAAHE